MGFASRPSTAGEVNLWKSILNSVSATPAKPTAHLLLLGGGAQGLTQCVDSWRTHKGLPGLAIEKDASATPIPAALPGATTYFDLQDGDQDETLCRFICHLFPRPDASIEKLLTGALMKAEEGSLAVCILLDWQEPWRWLEQLAQWMRLLEAAKEQAVDASTDFAQNLKKQTDSLELAIRGYSDDPLTATLASKQDVSLLPPLAPGQFDAPLGLPLFCIAQNAHHIFKLESEYSMREEQFDFIQQSLRLVMMAHGGSLFYTAPAQPATSIRVFSAILQQLQPALSQSLERVSASVIEKDQAAVPLGWDTPVKIEVHRDGTNVTELAAAWKHDLHDSGIEQDTSLVQQYAKNIPNVQANRLLTGGIGLVQEEFVATESHQAFLARLEQQIRVGGGEIASAKQQEKTKAALEEKLNRLRHTPSSSSEKTMTDSSVASAYFKTLMERRSIDTQ